MTGRGAALLLPAVTLVLSGLSTGLPAYYLLGGILLLAYVYAAVSLLFLRLTLRSRVTLTRGKIMRGEETHIILKMRHAGLLPVADAVFYACVGDKRQEGDIPVTPFRVNECRLSVYGEHTGFFVCGVERIVFRDLFGLMRMKVRIKDRDDIMVLPRPYEVEKADFAVSDEGRSVLARTQEDYTSPEDVRAYLPGDAMKRVHWKLSARRGEMLVRRYETPAPPDTLILTGFETYAQDACGPEQRSPKAEDRRLSLLDAVRETAVAAAQMQLRDSCPVRAPFYGAQAAQFEADREDQLEILQEMLALRDANNTEPMEKVMRLETGLLRKTGAVILISAVLNADMVELAADMRRMGPNVRFYFVSYTPEKEEYSAWLNRLRNGLVEVCYVTPA